MDPSTAQQIYPMPSLWRNGSPTREILAPPLFVIRKRQAYVWHVELYMSFCCKSTDEIIRMIICPVPLCLYGPCWKQVNIYIFYIVCLNLPTPQYIIFELRFRIKSFCFVLVIQFTNSFFYIKTDFSLVMRLQIRTSMVVFLFPPPPDRVPQVLVTMPVIAGRLDSCFALHKFTYNRCLFLALPCHACLGNGMCSRLCNNKTIL